MSLISESESDADADMHDDVLIGHCRVVAEVDENENTD